MSTSTHQDYYKLLGISYSASIDEIKKSYRKLCLKYHPDKTSDKAHHELFIKIREAYETLKAPESKSAYDKKHGINRSMNYTTSASSYASSSSPFGASKQTGYYSFYQHLYAKQRTDFKKAEEALRKEREVEAEKVKKREREIFMRRREELLKREREDMLRREEERKKEEAIKVKEQKDIEHIYLQRKRESYRKQWEQSFNPLDQRDDEFDRQYFISKQSKYKEEVKQDYATRSSENVGPEQSFQSAYSHDQWPSSSDTDFAKHGNNLNDPIVLDDEDDGNETREMKETSTPDTKSAQFKEAKEVPQDSFGSNTSSSDDEFVSIIDAGISGDSNDNDNNNDDNNDNNNINNNNNHNNNGIENENVEISNQTQPVLEENVDLNKVEHLFSQRMNIRQRQQPSRVYQKNRSVSPSKRTHGQAPTSYVRNDHSPTRNNSAKRSKIINTNLLSLDGLKEKLGTDIENVDFSDIFESLPKQSYSNGKNRKISEDITSNFKAKRPKLSEFSDGTSKAETLHIPINKNFVKGHSIPSDQQPKRSMRNITVLDLHASPTIHNYSPPMPPNALLDSRITDEEWIKYVTSIQRYEREFLNYKKHIVQYQLERFKKDEEYYELINSSSACFEVYQKCLQRDLNVIQEFTESLRVFTNTMNVYKQNCNWMKMSRCNGI